ncbi:MULTISPECIES: hypothetical protein [unclassified Microcoleus]|uniref:hypothetical protein n=1 Tax=unclassified Microcoleus TaxID=2642155 RepID=UPI0025F4304C|nr:MULTISPECIES: hypothetical protein [unclassified Microcoleus]
MEIGDCFCFVITNYQLPERIGRKPEPFDVEITIGLFITPILFLKGRGSSQTVKRAGTGAPPLQTVNCQLLNHYPIQLIG